MGRQLAARPGVGKWEMAPIRMTENMDSPPASLETAEIAETKRGVIAADENQIDTDDSSCKRQVQVAR